MLGSDFVQPSLHDSGIPTILAPAFPAGAGGGLPVPGGQLRAAAGLRLGGPGPGDQASRCSIRIEGWLGGRVGGGGGVRSSPFAPRPTSHVSGKPKVWGCVLSAERTNFGPLQ